MVHRLKVACLHPDLGIGGAERLVVDVAVSLQNVGHIVHMFTTHHDSDHCFPETKNGQFRVTVIGDWLPRSLLGRCRALCAYVRMIWMTLMVCFLYLSKFDLVFLDQISAAIPVIRMLSNVKVIFYCHFPDMLLTKRTSLLKKYYRGVIDFVEDWSTSKSDFIFFNSKFTESVSRQTFKCLTRRIPTDILYPCISQSLLSRDVSDIPLECCWIPENKTVIFTSLNRFERKKGIQLAINAFAILRENVDQALWEGLHLVIAGGFDPQLEENAEHLKELREMVNRLSLNDNVSFVLSPSEEMKLTIFKRSMALLYTPVEEHFGIVPLEAMFCQLPVIACKSGGPMETVIDQETGFLVEPEAASFASAMKEFLNNQDLKSVMGERGHRRVLEKFSAESFTHNLASVCQSLCS